MDEKEYKTNSLYMPSNISADKEILPRISNKEIKYFAYLLCFGVIVGIIISVFKGFQLGGIIAVPIIIFSYFLCARNPIDNCSTISYIIGIYDYFIKQNNYNYKYTEWWEKYLDDEEKEKR